METILIISALEKEILPVLEAIDSPLRTNYITETQNGRVYHIFHMSESLTIICTPFLGMGQLNAALAIREAVSNYGITKVILTGICAGIDKDMHYGDIIISDQIVDYELGKIKEDQVQVRWNVYRSDYELVQTMKIFKSDQWFNYLTRLFPQKALNKPNVYSGIVLSGNKVIANNEQVKRFKETWVKAVAIEMEAAGIAASLHMMKNPPSFVMVKSICDFADSQKNDEWQDYAAYTSAFFVLNYVFSVWESWTKGKESRIKRTDAPTIDGGNQKIVSVMRGTYNLSEINVLAFSLGIDIEDVPGLSKSEKIVELIKYCQRRNIVEKLVAQINAERDNILSEFTESNNQNVNRTDSSVKLNQEKTDSAFTKTENQKTNSEDSSDRLNQQRINPENKNIEDNNNSEKYSRKDFDDLEKSFVDELALFAFQQNKAEAMAKAILMQEISLPKRRVKRIREDQLHNICTFITNSTQACPLLIRGMPGTGKSTLLSLIYLKLQQEFVGGAFLFDLHVFDNMNKKNASLLLDRTIEHINTLIHHNERTLLFFDGLNQYKRHYPGFEDKFRKHISKWQNNRAVQIICSVGIQDDRQYPPFERFIQTSEIFAEHELTLFPIDVKTDKFSYLFSTILKLKALDDNKTRDRLITYCGMIDDGKSTIRTTWFIVNQFSILGQAIYSTPAGELLYNYYKDNIGLQKIRRISELVADFILEKPGAKIPDVVALKSSASLDFFFAYYCVESCTSGNNPEFVKQLDCVFTSRINRFVMQIAQLNVKREEAFIEALIKSYHDNLPLKTRTQIAYFLGRTKLSQKAVTDAATFLKSQYEKISDNYDNSRKNREEVMLLRTIGISLLYLGDSSYEKEFYSLIIYDEAMNRINRDFHIAYYTTNSYKLTDNTVFDKEIIYDLDNIKSVYSFLYHSVGKNTSPRTRCINIITIISLVVYWIYDLKSTGHNIEVFHGFRSLLSTLLVDHSIPDVIRDYIITTHRNLDKPSLYENALEKLYGFKTIMRKGWLKREIDKNSNVRIESDAEHTWACCILANILLPENIYDCELIMTGIGDFAHYSGYDKQRVLSLLLVHDLPECITGDVASPDKTTKDKENEKSAINNIRALGAFPGLSALYNVADDCKAFLSRDDKDADINVQIASDIDRLEPLIQLYFYRKYLNVPYDYSALTNWTDDDKFRIHTSFGNGLLETLKKSILNRECFQQRIEE